ncbi:MAG: sensor histidine kinase [Chloroflexi bacterium]|nr:MAG: sensor histidine kinase [Chloroflexota bacterium]
MQQLLSILITLDEMEAGRVALDRSRADLNAIVIDVVERAHKQTPAAVITITPDPSSPVVDCDHARVQQLLSILIDNAIRYSPAASQVDVAVARRADEVEVAVSDRGPGMAADDGIAAAAGNGARGTGLGLPIARQIVRLHGGRIWFISKPGQGTQVHFTLPAAAEAAVDTKVTATA